MNPDDIIRLLDELGKRLGPSGEYVFGLAIRQVYIEAIVGIGMFLVVAVAVALAARPVYRWCEDGDKYSDRQFVTPLGGTLAAVVLCFLAVNAVIQLQDVLNPEYAALRALIGTVAP